MSNALVCDECGETVDPSPDTAMYWYRIGWNGSEQQDACSVACAHALIEASDETALENSHQFHDGSDGDLECSECGEGPFAAWHRDDAREAMLTRDPEFVS